MIVVLRLGRGAIVNEIEYEVLRADFLGSKSHNHQYGDAAEDFAEYRPSPSGAVVAGGLPRLSESSKADPDCGGAAWANTVARSRREALAHRPWFLFRTPLTDTESTFVMSPHLARHNHGGGVYSGGLVARTVTPSLARI